MRTQYFGGAVPAATGVFFTSLASESAGAAIELVVAIERPPRDTLTLRPGSGAMDGRYLTPHLAEVTGTTTRAGVVVRTQHYTLDKSVTEERGRPLFRLRVDGLSDAPDPLLHVEVLLDHRTLALVHREDRGANGRRSSFDVDGSHVVGSIVPAADSMPVHVDFTLAEPAFLGSFLDAVANAAELHEGQVLRVPAFGLGASQRRLEWHHLRVIGGDTVRVRDHLANAWVVEESPGATFTSRRIWLLREPPYFPYDVTYFPDGSVQRVEQRLLHES